MVHRVTSDRLALWGVQGRPAASAIAATLSARVSPPTYMTSGCTTSTVRMAIIRRHPARSQSCSPPVTSMVSASVTCRVCSSSQ